MQRLIYPDDIIDEKLSGKGMWIYNPKVNRVINLPPSMMSQSWQGSDFSNAAANGYLLLTCYF